MKHLSELFRAPYVSNQLTPHPQISRCMNTGNIIVRHARRTMATKSKSRIAFLVFVWYVSSAFAVLMLKALFQGRFAPVFKFPFGVTASSNIVSACAATLVSSKAGIPPSASTPTHRYAALIGAMTAGEIGLSNAALAMLTVALATMLKGAAPLLVMGWGVLLRVYRPSLRTAAVVALVCAGLALAVDGQKTGQESPHALRLGVLFQSAAGVLSGLRWVITQLFVKGQQDESWLLHRVLGGMPERPVGAVEVVRLTAPYTALAVSPAVLYFEGLKLIEWFTTESISDSLKILAAATGIGSCVFALLWAEYELVSCTSSLTVSIGFVAKEVLVIAAGVVLFGDRITWRSAIGFLLVQVGIIAYTMRKESMTYDSLPRTVGDSTDCEDDP